MFNLANIFRTQTTSKASSSQKVVNYDFQKEAIVDETIHPRRSGRVYFQATWWPARCEKEITLETGDIVYVVGIYNITLLVEPAPFE
jgi:membrane protein implicated in regulation of membrane protease activity